MFLEGLRLADHDDVPPWARRGLTTRVCAATNRNLRRYFVALGPYVDLDDSLQGARLEELVRLISLVADISSRAAYRRAVRI